MRVKRLPDDPGLSGWRAILPDASPGLALEAELKADYLVIGAGFSGLSAARRLRQHDAKAKIVVLEARGIAEGPAGRNSGFMIDLPHDLSSENYGGSKDKDRLQIKMNRAAIAFAQEAATVYSMPKGVLEASGKVNAAASETGMAHNRAYSKHLESLGEPHELLDADQMRELTGSSYYPGGLRTPGTVLIQPAHYVRCLAEGLRNEAVQVFENSPVTSLKRDDGVWVAATPNGSVQAEKVILATNGHVESFGHFRRRLVHIYLYASMTRALNKEELKQLGGARRWGLTPSDPLGSTVRRISGKGGDRIVVRNRVTYNPSMRADPNRMQRLCQSHDASFAVRFPQLSAVTMEYRWGGQLCLSRNGVPAFGEMETNLYSACCQNGLGSTRGTLSGMLAADLSCGVNSELLVAQLELPKPSRLPPEPFASIGANSVLWWGERKAGAEL